MRTYLSYSAICLMACLLVACNIPSRNATSNGESDAEPTTEVTETIIPVEAQRPVRGDISSYSRTDTRVEAENQVEVVAEGSGKCLDVLAEEGDDIERGQILAELDKEDVQAQLQQSEIQMRQARADYERAKKGFEEDLIPRVEYDNAKYSYENAVASYDVQKLQLENMTVRAPIGGVVTERAVQKGMLVSQGTPLFTVVDPTTFVLNINLPEDQIPHVKAGQMAIVSVDALPGKEFQARVSRINPNVDPTTGTVKVRLEVPEEVRAQLPVAAFARVRLIMDTHENALLVPKDAVVEENAREYVFVVDQHSPEPEEAAAVELETSEGEPEEPLEAAAADEGEDAVEGERPVYHARRVEVEVGLEDSEFTEILSGISDDDMVITMGQKNLKPDARVMLTSASEQFEAKAGISATEALAAAERERERLKRERDERRRQEAEQQGNAASESDEG